VTFKGPFQTKLFYASIILGITELQLNMKEVLLQHDDTNKAIFSENANIIFEKKLYS